MTFTSMLGWSLAIAATLTAWPQTVKIIKTKNVTGVNPYTTMTASITMVAWSLYAGRLGDIPALSSALGPLAAWGVTLTLLVKHRTPGARHALAATLGSAAILGALGTSSHWTLLAWICGIGSASWALPQLVTAASRTELTGVSVTAYVAMTLENIGWIAYAYLTHTPAYAVGAAVQTPILAYIALRAHRQQRYGQASKHQAGHAETGRTHTPGHHTNLSAASAAT